jgi:hypothetical protein
MTIQEPIKSVKRFKRPGQDWVYSDYKYWKIMSNGQVMLNLGPDELRCCSFDVEHILATDWEIEEDKFEVSESEIRNLVINLQNRFDFCNDVQIVIASVIENLKHGAYR